MGYRPHGQWGIGDNDYRGYEVQGVMATWAMGQRQWGTGGNDYSGYGAHGQWGTGDNWVQGLGAQAK